MTDSVASKAHSTQLDEFEEYLKEQTANHLGYPYNLDFDHERLARFLKYSINNLGDPYHASNYGVHSREFEVEILEFFSKLWKIPYESSWGYVTNSGAEGNMQGLLVARENLPDGIVYTSSESHDSVLKAVHFYRMEATVVDAEPNGCICLRSLREKIAGNITKPVIINANIGTTFKGGIDDVKGIIALMKDMDIPKDRYYIHCDGALFAMMLAFFDKYGENVNFEMPIDSIAISGHMFMGAPMPCGVFLTRRKLMGPLFKPIEYLNSVDGTIAGSRNGLSCVFLWNTIKLKGTDGFRVDAQRSIENAKYLVSELNRKSLSCIKNPFSNIVVFNLPNPETCERFVRKWQLACNDEMAHVVVMPSVCKDTLDKFVEELTEIVPPTPPFINELLKIRVGLD